MAYKSLYRAYRPQVFEDVEGQEAIITTLKHAVEENKIAHAYLFCGPRGTGKTSIAKIFAKAVNCQEDHRPCGECDSCKAIENGSHPDIIEIDAASNNGVEQVRDLIDKVKYAPVEGKYKVYIIDEVHMMSPGAFNALLKTLEEPPAHVIFILATTEPHKILPTIISRCQRFDFTSLTEEELIHRMETVMQEEGKTYEEGALQLIAKLANGGMRDALSILEQCLAYNDDHLSSQDVNEIYGIVSMEDKLDFIRVILARNMEKALGILDKMDRNGTDIKLLTNDLIDILKDVVIYKNTRNAKILFVLTQTQAEAIAPYITSEEALFLIDLLVEASEKYARSVNPHIYFELTILKVCNQDHNNVVQAQPQTVVVNPAPAAPVKQVPPVKEEAAPVPAVEEEEEVVQEFVEEEPVYEEPAVEETPVAEEVVEQAPVVEATPAVEEEHYEPAPAMEAAPIEDINDIPASPANDDQPPVFEFNDEPVAQAVVDHTDEDIQVSTDDIMNILVQADRKLLDAAKEKWPVIGNYRTQLKVAKYASMLSVGTPVAACDSGLIISYEFKPDVNQINYYKNYLALQSLLNEVFGKKIDFIAIQHDEWLDMRKHFIVLHKAHNLPAPHPITLQHLQGKDLEGKEELSDAQKFALDMFGKDIVEFTEED